MIRSLPLAAAVLASALIAPAAGAQMTESSAEVRFQLDLKVPDAAIARYVPQGWSLNVAAQGPARDANLRLIFVDRITINGPDGRPAGRTGSSRLVYLAAPVKDPDGAPVQLIVGGLTDDPAGVPGPFGNFLLASTHSMRRATSSGSGAVVESQDWVFAAASGEHLEMHVTFERGAGNRNNPSESRLYSAKDPAVFQVSMQEQVLDILRNTTTTPPDRVKAFSLKASGGSYAALFDGTERVLSWDNIPYFNRAVLAR
ncbi:MAG: hypothetical protein IT176_02280 [Acidobacteria bacterium]|nr:hypothetical protein [Acidobacteriota bacterium]